MVSVRVGVRVRVRASVRVRGRRVLDAGAPLHEARVLHLEPAVARHAAEGRPRALLGAEHLEHGRGQRRQLVEPARRADQLGGHLCADDGGEIRGNLVRVRVRVRVRVS